jgi:ferredoxin--NADP+ reductase
MIDKILEKGKATLETISQLHWWNDRLFTFRTSRPTDYVFTAGQYARLGLADQDEVTWRAYSMTSAPADEYLEFYGIVVPGGRFTSAVQKLEVGSPILVEKQSYGFMTVDRFTDGDDLWMLATGTGIGPFISILRDPLAWRKFRRLILVHCTRHAIEFAYRDMLSQMAQQPPTSAMAQLQVIYTATREAPQDPAQHLTGRITTLLDNGELERVAGAALSEQASRLMLCGNPEMIEQTRSLLHSRGLRPVRRATPGQFVTENYW